MVPGLILYLILSSFVYYKNENNIFSIIGKWPWSAKPIWTRKKVHNLLTPNLKHFNYITNSLKNNKILKTKKPNKTSLHMSL